MSSLDVAREVHKSLLAAKSVVEHKMATTPPSVKRYAHYKHLLTDYDNRIISSEETIKQLEEKIIIADTEANKVKLIINEVDQYNNEPDKETIYSVILKSIS